MAKRPQGLSKDELIERLIGREETTDVDRQIIARVLARAPQAALEKCVSMNVRIIALHPGERYDDASPSLARMGVDVDGWPAPPAGLFVVDERTVYVRSRSAMTIAHEFGHAVDCAYGGGIYRSGQDPAIRASYANSREYVTPYASTGLDEYFAEGFRAVCEINDPASPWPPATRERLARIDPDLYAYFENELGFVNEPELHREPSVEVSVATTAPRELDAAVLGRAQSPATADVEKNDKRTEFYRGITQDLVQLIEQGGLPQWQRFWTDASLNGLPRNATTKLAYRGINTVRLALTAAIKGYADQRWMTVKQANAKGWRVRAGERGTPIEVWKWKSAYSDRAGKPVEEARAKEILADPARKGEIKERRYGVHRTFAVFNASQVDVPQKRGDEIENVPLSVFEPQAKPSFNLWEQHDRAERIIAAVGIPLEHIAQGRAYYSPTFDKIVLPKRSQFDTASDYYDVALHEVGHGTGHESRLARETLARIGSTEWYAKEELRAELTSFFMAAELGLPHNAERHASYLGHWASLLKSSSHEIFAAARDAQAAHDFILEAEAAALSREYEATKELADLNPTRIELEMAGISAFAAPDRRDYFQAEAIIRNAWNGAASKHAPELAAAGADRTKLDAARFALYSTFTATIAAIERRLQVSVPIRGDDAWRASGVVERLYAAGETVAIENVVAIASRIRLRDAEVEAHTLEAVDELAIDVAGDRRLVAQVAELRELVAGRFENRGVGADERIHAAILRIRERAPEAAAAKAVAIARAYDAYALTREERRSGIRTFASEPTRTVSAFIEPKGDRAAARSALLQAVNAYNELSRSAIRTGNAFAWADASTALYEAWRTHLEACGLPEDVRERAIEDLAYQSLRSDENRYVPTGYAELILDRAFEDGPAESARMLELDTLVRQTAEGAYHRGGYAFVTIGHALLGAMRDAVPYLASENDEQRHAAARKMQAAAVALRNIPELRTAERSHDLRELTGAIYERAASVAMENAVEPSPRFSPLLTPAAERDARRDRFIERLVAIGDDRTRVWSICVNEVRSLNAIYEPSTVRRMMVAYRDAVRDRLGADHAALSYLRATRKDERAISEATRARVDERLHDLRPLDAEIVVEKARALLESERWADRAAGVAIATGRRLPEIAALSTFEAIEGREDAIRFSGGVRGTYTAYEIPTLLESGAVLEAIEQLREQRPLGDRSAAQISNGSGKDVAKAVSAALGETYSLTEVRDVYATIAHDWFAPSDRSFTNYVASVLGHEPGDATTALSHVGFYPIDKEQETCETLERSRLELIAETRSRLNSAEWSPAARARLEGELERLQSLTFEARPEPPDVALENVSPLLSEQNVPISAIEHRLRAAIEVLDSGSPAALYGFLKDERPGMRIAREDPTGTDVLVSLQMEAFQDPSVESVRDRCAPLVAQLAHLHGEAAGELDAILSRKMSAPRYIVDRDNFPNSLYIVRDTITGDTFRKESEPMWYRTRSLEAATRQADRLNRADRKDVPARIGARASDRSAPALQAQSLHKEPEMAKAMQRVTLVGKPALTNLQAKENVTRLGLGLQTKVKENGQDVFKTNWFDVVAFKDGDLAQKLADAAREAGKEKYVQVQGVVNKSSYEKDGKKRRTTEVVIDSVSVVEKSERPKITNEWIVRGTVRNAPEVNERGTFAKVQIEVDRPGKEGAVHKDYFTVVVPGAKAKDAAALEPGKTYDFSGKYEVDNYLDKSEVKQKDPQLKCFDFGADLGVAKKLGVEAEQAAPAIEAPAIPAPAVETPAAQLPNVIDPEKANGRVIDRESLPYLMTGEILGQSPDGAKIFMALGRGDMLAIEKSSFDGPVPEVGKTYELAFREGEGREKATLVNEHENAQGREAEREPEHAVA